MNNQLLLLPAPKLPNKFLILNALIVIGVLSLFASLSVHKQVETYKAPEIFTALPLDAKAVYVYDVADNKVIFQKNQNAILPLASLTKLMMALTASELIPQNSNIVIKKEFLQDDGIAQFQLDEKWKVKNLLDFSLVVSSNDGARSIASVAGAMDLKTTDYNLGRKDFIAKMNEEGKKLGLQTTFTTENGLDVGTTPGGLGSAEDIAKLLTYVIKNKPGLLEATRYAVTTVDSLNTKHVAKNTDEIINQIPDLIASKTGYTDLAGGNLAVAFDSSIGHPIVIVVLGSTKTGRFDDVVALVKASLEYSRE